MNVCFILRSPSLARWEASSVRAATKMDAVVSIRTTGDTRRTDAITLYLRAEAAAVGRRAGIDDPFQMTSLSGLLSGEPSIATDDPIQETSYIRVNLSTEALRELSNASGETWHFVHGGRDSLDVVGAYVHEVRKGSSCIRTRIVGVSAHGTRVVAETWSSIHARCLYVGLARLAWKMRSMLIRELDRVANGSAAVPATEMGLEKIGLPEVPAPERPSCLWLASHAFRVGLGMAKRLIERRGRTDEWVIGIRSKSAGNRKFHVIDAPPGRFLADPFVVSEEGQHFVYCEDFIRSEGRAVISCLVFTAEFEVNDARTILERPFHLSFPFVFTHDDEFFMIPESGENSCIELFRCVDFPFVWESAAVLVNNIEARDSVIWHDGQTFWLFTCIAETRGGTSDDLWLFSSDSISGPWRPHPANPVVSDVRSARAAGAIFEREGALIRPSQDCAGGYGRRVLFNEITCLSGTRYEEVAIGEFGPQWYPRAEGAHTYNASDSVEVVDARLS